jgi:hypothetical protein
MVEECESIIVEFVFNSKWSLIEGYHSLGKRILEEKKNFEKAGIKDVASRVATSMGRNVRTIERAVQFAEKYPDLDKLPGGKAISWHYVCNELLPEGKSHHKHEWEEKNVTVTLCRVCGAKKI